jgi:hypothetical protein
VKTPQERAVEEAWRCERERDALAAENDQLRAWFLVHLGDVLELILTPILDAWLARARPPEDETAESIAADPRLSAREVRYLLELWTLRDDVRRELRHPSVPPGTPTN